MKKILLVVFDGLGDRPIKNFGGKTPLEAATKPNIDELASKSRLGTMNPIPTTQYPTSENSHLAIFGYDYVKDYPGRGVLEGLGIGLKIKEDELVFRVDFGTVDEELRLLDPRAGMIENTKKLASAIDKVFLDGITFRIYPSLQHRGVLTLSGEPVARYLKMVRKAEVSDTDPHKAGPHKIDVRVLRPKAFGESKEGKLVARSLERYQFLSHQILNEHGINKKRIKKGLPPANFVLTRGGGHLGDIKSFQQKYNLKAACIAGAPLYKGIARYLGMSVINVRGANGKPNTNIKNKVKAAVKALRKYDYVYLHFKGTDSLAEEYGDSKGKKAYIERADKEFSKFLKIPNLVMVITGDHATPCVLKDHSTDIVPFLLYDGKNTDHKTEFGEKFCSEGSIGHIFGNDIMSIMEKAARDV